MTQINILVIHRSAKTAASLVDAIQKQMPYAAFPVSEGVESIAAIQSLEPDVLLVDAEFADMPAAALVLAARQMRPHVICWLIGNDPGTLRGAAKDCHPVGILNLPLSKESINGLTSPPEESMSSTGPFEDDETLQGFVSDRRLWDNEVPGYRRIRAGELKLGCQVHHQGDVEIDGDLHDVRTLEVSGDLRIHGSVTGAHIRCEGNLHVEGDIRDCRALGVFCRGSIFASNIENALVVSGSRVVFRTFCRKSVINAVDRLVATYRSSFIAGCKVRVGQHLHVSTLGDEDHTETLVELAAPILREAWMRYHRGLYTLAAKRGQVAVNKAAFEENVALLEFYHLQAHARIREVLPGVTIRIGTAEKYLFEPKKGPFRVLLRQSGKKQRVLLHPLEKSR